MLCCVLSNEQKGTKQRKAKQRKAESKAKLNQLKQSNATQGGTCYASWHMLRCVAVSALLAVLFCAVSYCVVLGCAVSCGGVLCCVAFGCNVLCYVVFYAALRGLQTTIQCCFVHCRVRSQSVTCQSQFVCRLCSTASERRLQALHYCKRKAGP